MFRSGTWSPLAFRVFRRRVARSVARAGRDLFCRPFFNGLREEIGARGTGVAAISKKGRTTRGPSPNLSGVTRKNTRRDIVSMANLEK